MINFVHRIVDHIANVVHFFPSILYNVLIRVSYEQRIEKTNQTQIPENQKMQTDAKHSRSS